MQDPMLSTPTYKQVQDVQLRHGTSLFLLQYTQHEMVQNLMQQLDDSDQKNILVCADAADATLDLEMYFNRIRQQLEHIETGWHMIVFGNEVFVWQVARFLLVHGLMKDEMSLLSDAGLRQVYCVHCAHQQLHGAEDFCHCDACGVYLFVRSHFSERLGAYMGVCANAVYPQGDVA